MERDSRWLECVVITSIIIEVTRGLVEFLISGERNIMNHLKHSIQYTISKLKSWIENDFWRIPYMNTNIHVLFSSIQTKYYDEVNVDVEKWNDEKTFACHLKWRKYTVTNLRLNNCQSNVAFLRNVALMRIPWFNIFRL